jgi:hypothetical protein
MVCNGSYSVKQIAERYGVNVTKVGQWIANGQLRGINIALRPGRRPRWRILAADLAAFEAARSATPPPPPMRRRRRADPEVIQFF